MSNSSLIQEFQDFSKKTNELQQQYITLMNQLIPSKELENRSLLRAKGEIESLADDAVLYHSTGKIFLQSDLSITKKMVDTSMESNQRSYKILLERKAVLEKSLKEAEEKHKFYLENLGGGK